jgi:hypothetical protein
MADTQIWGPPAWKFLHTLTFSYPDNPSQMEREHAERLFESMRYLLPCQSCRKHYDIEYAKNPPDTTSGTTLSSWLVDVHNRVNVRLGKDVVSYLDAARMYKTGQCSRDCNGSKQRVLTTTKSKTSYFFTIFFLLICAVFGWTHKEKVLGVFKYVQEKIKTK